MSMQFPKKMTNDTVAITIAIIDVIKRFQVVYDRRIIFRN